MKNFLVCVAKFHIPYGKRMTSGELTDLALGINQGDQRPVFTTWFAPMGEVSP
jgi:hypothetical protein